MNAKGEAWVRLGLVGVLILGILLLVSGCSSNTSTGTPLAAQNIFVVQGSAVSTFPLTASGNVAPSGTLSGANTKINDAHRLAFDTILNGYVSNAVGNSVTIYAPGTSGNSAPTATISGAATELTFPEGISLDSHNDIYVANCGSCVEIGGIDSVTIYNPGSTGDVAPAAAISGAETGLDGPNGLALDGTANMYVANETGNTVTIYLSLFLGGGVGNAPPLLTIRGAGTGISRPHDLTVDPGGNLYVTNSGNDTVTIYAAGDIGNAFTATLACIAALPAAPPPTLAQEAACSVQDLVPAVTIKGGGLNNPNGIAFDASGKDNYAVASLVADVDVSEAVESEAVWTIKPGIRTANRGRRCRVACRTRVVDRYAVNAPDLDTTAAVGDVDVVVGVKIDA